MQTQELHDVLALAVRSEPPPTGGSPEVFARARRLTVRHRAAHLTAVTGVLALLALGYLALGTTRAPTGQTAAPSSAAQSANPRSDLIGSLLPAGAKIIAASEQRSDNPDTIRGTVTVTDPAGTTTMTYVVQVISPTESGTTTWTDLVTHPADQYCVGASHDTFMVVVCATDAPLAPAESASAGQANPFLSYEQLRVMAADPGWSLS